MKSFLTLLAVAFSLVTPQLASADIVRFIATGTAGDGLLEGNIDPATGEQGTGGLRSQGITYNTDNNLLRIDIGWGSANGFADMSLDVFRVHLHGPTASSGSAAFGEIAPLLITLSTSTSFDPSATSGGINDLFLVEQANEQELLDGRMYINVHLSSSDTGMIRGYLQSVPEPGSVAILSALGGLMVLRRRRRTS